MQKTRVRAGVTLAHGRVRIGLTVRRCRAKCRGGARAARPSSELSALFPARATFGYDVIVRVGLDRFLRYRQRDEIRAALATEGVDLSEAQVSLLGRRFLVYLEALHRERAPKLRAALAADGGWPMHVDATGEDGRGTLLVVYAGWRGWVLGAWKVPTERADIILPRLRQVAERFGPPCAIMRDLGRAVTEASATFVAERRLSIPILACHMHFLRDVGSDLMRSKHDELRGHFRHFKLLPKLRCLARDLGRRLGPALPQARKDLERWLRAEDRRHRFPAGDQGLAVVRALAQWVLDFPSDGFDQGFPFDVPMLDLYDRSIEVLAALDAFLRTAPSDATVRGAAEHLHRILRPIDSEVPFERIAHVLGSRRTLFNELRDALRLGPRPAHLTRRRAAAAGTKVELDEVRAAVKQLTRALRRRRPTRGPAQDTRRGIDLVLDHLDRHASNLWGHAVRLRKGGTRTVARTNNDLEGFFRDFKHDERRRSGRRILTQDLEHLPPAAALARNLARTDYVEILSGSLTQLPAAFAQLDADGQVRTDTDTSAEMVSRSLPTIDRDLVRNDELFQRINAAANSRAPRR
ncbi:MAG TPA: hypothetical protein VLV25_05185 [Steroidobacteraceae bacterium]|nr:hypothetical protein [Steroidobacteraceae bacterium]